MISVLRLENMVVLDKAIIFSLDEKNLFTNIPRLEVSGLFKEDMVKCYLSDINVIKYFKLLIICMEQNFFFFNRNLFTMDDGLSMGDCLPPFIINFVKDKFENDEVNNFTS